MKLILENWRPYGVSLLVVVCMGIMINLGSNGRGDMTTGKGVYEAYCANCHGIDGTGKGLSADFVNDEERMSKSDEELLNSIRNGLIGPRGYMPPWKEVLTEEQMTKALHYIRNSLK